MRRKGRQVGMLACRYGHEMWRHYVRNGRRRRIRRVILNFWYRVFFTNIFIYLYFTTLGGNLCTLHWSENRQSCEIWFINWSFVWWIAREKILDFPLKIDREFYIFRIACVFVNTNIFIYFTYTPIIRKWTVHFTDFSSYKLGANDIGFSIEYCWGFRYWFKLTYALPWFIQFTNLWLPNGST